MNLTTVRQCLALIVIGAAVLFSGCVTSSVSRLNDTQRAPISPSEVTVYLDEKDIEGDYEQMALIDLSGSSSWTDQSDVYEKARKEAAEIGANGVLFRSYEEAGTGEKVASALLGTSSDNDAEMIAIYVYSESNEEKKIERLESMTKSEEDPGG